MPRWGTTADPERIHGMAINAGESRIRTQGLSCNTCHQTRTPSNTVPHAAPHTGMEWRLAPVEFQWTERTNAEICA